jgi:hypothetical protein
MAGPVAAIPVAHSLRIRRIQIPSRWRAVLAAHDRSHSRSARVAISDITDSDEIIGAGLIPRDRCSTHPYNIGPPNAKPQGLLGASSVGTDDQGRTGCLPICLSPTMPKPDHTGMRLDRFRAGRSTTQSSVPSSGRSGQADGVPLACPRPSIIGRRQPPTVGHSPALNDTSHRPPSCTGPTRNA